MPQVTDGVLRIADVAFDVTLSPVLPLEEPLLVVWMHVPVVALAYLTHKRTSHMAIPTAKSSEVHKWT